MCELEEGLDFVDSWVVNSSEQAYSSINAAKTPWHPELLGLETELVRFPPEILGFSTVSSSSLSSSCATSHLYGIFPEVRASWITRDHILYTWSYKLLRNPNYNTNSYTNTAVAIVPLDAVILSVKLIQPREGVFNDVHFIIVVTTTVTVNMIGLTLVNGELQTRKLDGYHCSTNGHPLEKIVATEDGRVYISSLRHVFELSYDRSGCRLVNVTASYFPTLKAVIVGRDPYLKLLSVAQHSYLATTDEYSALRVFGIRDCGPELESLLSMSMEDLEMSLNREFGFRTLQSREYTHISICVGTDQMAHVWLLTSAWERIHLRCYMDENSAWKAALVAYSTLNPTSGGSAPSTDAAFGSSTKSAAAASSLAGADLVGSYSNGVWALCNGTGEVCFSVRVLHPTQHNLFEMVGNHKFGGKTDERAMALVEEPDIRIVKDKPIVMPTECEGELGVFRKKRTYVLLTNAGLHVFSLHYLYKSAPRVGPPLSAFQCAMCLVENANWTWRMDDLGLIANGAVTNGKWLDAFGIYLSAALEGLWKRHLIYLTTDNPELNNDQKQGRNLALAIPSSSDPRMRQQATPLRRKRGIVGMLMQLRKFSGPYAVANLGLNYQSGQDQKYKRAMLSGGDPKTFNGSGEKMQTRCRVVTNPAKSQLSNAFTVATSYSYYRVNLTEKDNVPNLIRKLKNSVAFARKGATQCRDVFFRNRGQSADNEDNYGDSQPMPILDDAISTLQLPSSPSNIPIQTHNVRRTNLGSNVLDGGELLSPISSPSSQSKRNVTGHSRIRNAGVVSSPSVRRGSDASRFGNVSASQDGLAMQERTPVHTYGNSLGETALIAAPEDLQGGMGGSSGTQNSATFENNKFSAKFRNSYYTKDVSRMEFLIERNYERVLSVMDVADRAIEILALFQYIQSHPYLLNLIDTSALSPGEFTLENLCSNLQPCILFLAAVIIQYPKETADLARHCPTLFSAIDWKSGLRESVANMMVEGGAPPAITDANIGTTSRQLVIPPQNTDGASLAEIQRRWILADDSLSEADKMMRLSKVKEIEVLCRWLEAVDIVRCDPSQVLKFAESITRVVEGSGIESSLQFLLPIMLRHLQRLISASAGTAAGCMGNMNNAFGNYNTFGGNVSGLGGAMRRCTYVLGCYLSSLCPGGENSPVKEEVVDQLLAAIKERSPEVVPCVYDFLLTRSNGPQLLIERYGSSNFEEIREFLESRYCDLKRQLSFRYRDENQNMMKGGTSGSQSKGAASSSDQKTQSRQTEMAILDSLWQFYRYFEKFQDAATVLLELAEAPWSSSSLSTPSSSPFSDVTKTIPAALERRLGHLRMCVRCGENYLEYEKLELLRSRIAICENHQIPIIRELLRLSSDPRITHKTKEKIVQVYNDQQLTRFPGVSVEILSEVCHHTHLVGHFIRLNCNVGPSAVGSGGEGVDFNSDGIFDYWVQLFFPSIGPYEEMTLPFAFFQREAPIFKQKDLVNPSGNGCSTATITGMLMNYYEDGTHGLSNRASANNSGLTEAMPIKSISEKKHSSDLTEKDLAIMAGRAEFKSSELVIKIFEYMLAVAGEDPSRSRTHKTSNRHNLCVLLEYVNAILQRRMSREKARERKEKMIMGLSTSDGLGNSSSGDDNDSDMNSAEEKDLVLWVYRFQQNSGMSDLAVIRLYMEMLDQTEYIVNKFPDFVKHSEFPKIKGEKDTGFQLEQLGTRNGFEDLSRTEIVCHLTNIVLRVCESWFHRVKASTNTHTFAPFRQSYQELNQLLGKKLLNTVIPEGTSHYAELIGRTQALLQEMELLFKGREYFG